MFSKKDSQHKIDPEQRELIEKAQLRTRQKRNLYTHFIFFLISSVVFILLYTIFDVGTKVHPFGIDWFVWLIGIWAILLLLHVYNVFVTNKFLGKDWEDKQIERLVVQQKKRIAELKTKVETQHPLPKKEKPWMNPQKKIDPNNPLNS